jgi:hypothetical protein
MDEEEEIEEDKPVDQPENSPKGRAAHLAPWQFKKGQSGNPLGRFPGKSMKEFAKAYRNRWYGSLLSPLLGY